MEQDKGGPIKCEAGDGCIWSGGSVNALNYHMKTAHGLLAVSETPAVSVLLLRMIFSKWNVPNAMLDSPSILNCWSMWSNRMASSTSRSTSTSSISATTRLFCYDLAETYAQAWLNEIRDECCVDLVAHRAEKTNKDGSRSLLLECSRSGAAPSVDAQAIGKVPRISKKIDATCTAHLKVREDVSGAVHVAGCLEHFGHEENSALLRLLQHEINTLVEFLRAGHSRQWILEHIWGKFVEILSKIVVDREGGDDRLAHVSTKDLDNLIARRSALRPERLDKNDLRSLEKFVEQDQTNAFKKIFVYARPVSEYGEGFALGVQTEDQLALFRKYGHRGLCLDGTHNLTRYNFRLITALVIADSGHGLPIAHLLTVSESEEHLQLLFQHLKTW
jgi:plasmid stabilization system protein ParE